jgi:SAM-dependent methyltransferase
VTVVKHTAIPSLQPSEERVRDFYEAHARSYGPTEFQNQVGRQLASGTVGPEQIELIIEAIGRGLALEPRDWVLDLCCGNGAITDRVFDRCAGGVGVDFTPYLIEVAKRNFERPARAYHLADVLEFVEVAPSPECFTKISCYGSFFTLLEAKATRLLSVLYDRFPNVNRAFLGNLPDLDKAALFFRRDRNCAAPPLERLRRHDNPGGIWRTETEMRELVRGTGWQIDISRMPSEFFAAHYRFDAILFRVSGW